MSLPVVVEGGKVRFGGQVLDIDRQGVADGAAALFIRPYDVALLPEPWQAALQGRVTRVHGLGGSRRVEVSVTADGASHLVEVDAPRSLKVETGQAVGLQPNAYHIFRNGSSAV